jgi:cold-inducible RNA-binding protein
VNIFIGNLAYSATEQALRQLFESYGAVEKIQIITDRDTGRSKGFGFVEMPETQAATAAIEGLNGTELDGRALTVNEAKVSWRSAWARERVAISTSKSCRVLGDTVD